MSPGGAGVSRARPGSALRLALTGGALCGALLAFSTWPWPQDMPPWGPGLQALLAMGAAFWLLERLALRPPVASGPTRFLPAWLGWAFGTAWLVTATGWMFISLHRYGGLPAWLAALAVFLLCAALALYMALAFHLWARWRTGRVLPDVLRMAGLWMLAEVARALIFTGFPWAAAGHAQIDSPLAALAPWVGVYGIGGVMAVLAMAGALAVARAGRARAQALGAATVATGVVLLAALVSPPGHFVKTQGQPLSVSLIQSNVPQDEKFLPERLGAMVAWHARQLVDAESDLVMAPETAIPLLPADLPPDFWEALLQHFHQSDRAALFGVPLGSLEEGYTNSVVGVSAATVDLPGGVYRYNKHHLVPFGEFIPWGFHWFVNLMNMPLGDFARGPRNAPSFPVRDQWVAPNICYEDLFGEELAARFLSPQPPTVLANVSNLAWFGDTVAIGQHLAIARLRSLEFQRPTLRSTNTGATVVIDHLGHVSDALPGQTRGVLTASVQGTSGLTPYAQWAGRWGLWPLIGLSFALVVMGVRLRRPLPT